MWARGRLDDADNIVVNPLLEYQMEVTLAQQAKEAKERAIAEAAKPKEPKLEAGASSEPPSIAGGPTAMRLPSKKGSLHKLNLNLDKKPKQSMLTRTPP